MTAHRWRTDAPPRDTWCEVLDGMTVNELAALSEAVDAAAAEFARCVAKAGGK